MENTMQQWKWMDYSMQQYKWILETLYSVKKIGGYMQDYILIKTRNNEKQCGV